MRKLITCLLSGVLVGSMLLTPASATTTSVISDDPSIDNSSVVPYASLFATNVALVKSGTIPKQKVLGFSIGMSNAFPAILNIVIRSIIAM